MALHIIVSASLMLAFPLVVRAAMGLPLELAATDFVSSVVTAICAAGGVVIGASSTRHTGEGYAKAQASKAAIEALPVIPQEAPETRPGEEPYHG
jgi:hypothetical protein